MNPDLETLIQLQKADAELKRTEGELLEIPRQKAAGDGRLAEEREKLERAREALSLSQKNRRQHEGALQDLETRRSKYKGQLMEVKTNKEYTAMLHEIENVEREIKAREDQVLEEMERAEALAAELKREEAAFKAAEEQTRGEHAGLEKRKAVLEADAARQLAQREALAASVSEEALALYARVARLRGSAVAEAKDEVCQLCHVKLRPQMYVDLKRNESIVQCPSCSRILYFEPAVPVVAPGP